MSTALAICSEVRSYTASSTQVVCASTRCDTQAPPEVNLSATSTCSRLSRAMSRTTRLVSTARMLLAHVFSNRILNVRFSLLGHLLWKERRVNVHRRISPCSANKHAIIVLVPFEDGAWTDAELLANLGRYGDLTLCGNF